MDSWSFVIGAALYVAMTIAAIRSAYSNGANDGYGYARDCTNPGYQRAGEIIYATMSHRYDNVPKPGDPTTPANDLRATMRILELKDQIKHYRNQVTMHHNGMVDISIMIDEGNYDEARAKALSFTDDEEAA